MRTLILSLCLIALLPVVAMAGPHYWQVTVTYADGSTTVLHNVVELEVDTEGGEVVAMFGRPDADGFYGQALELLPGATVALAEESAELAGR